MDASDHLRLILVRHGQVESNRQFRYVGRRDEPLTALGERQAGSVAEALSVVAVREVVSSPLLRARSTAEPIARACQVGMRVDQRLAEQSFGRWEGLTRKEVQALGEEDRADQSASDGDPGRAPPGGDSLLEVQVRVVELAEQLFCERSDGQGIVLVSHVGPIKALLAAALDIELMQARRLFLDPATITVVDWGRPSWLRLFNAHGHLGWPNARWMGASG